jgi:hypothetical protein
MSDRLTVEQLRWSRLSRSGLVRRFPSAVAAAHALVGVQAQLLPAAGLALWNRTPRMTHELFSSILLKRRHLIRTWGQRGTLHLYARDDWPLIIASLAPKSYHRSYGFADSEEGRQQHLALLALVEGEVLRKGNMARSELRASGMDLPEICYNQWGGVFYDLAIRGRVCLSQRDGAGGAFAHRDHWTPGMEWDPPSHEEANLELWRRHIKGYGPANQADFVYWSGRKVAQAKVWRKILDVEMEEIDGPDGPLLSLKNEGALDPNVPEEGRWPCRLLYRFDPVLLGWKDRSWLVPKEHFGRVSRPAGIIEGVILSSKDGMAYATWKYERTAKELRVLVSPFEELDDDDRRKASAQADMLGNYFGLEARLMVPPD